MNRVILHGTQAAANFSICMTGSEEMQGPWIRYGQLALVCEGGGQRGIFTSGILDSFMQNGFFPFRTLIGTSAGAQNLSAYACGAHGYARHAILRYSTHRAFFSPLRFARGGHLIDLDWYFETLQKEAPLDLESGRKRLDGRSLYVCASRRDTLKADYLPFHVDSARQAIKASSAIPLFYRGGVALNGVDYVDGGVADALPVRAAHARGGDCVVVIRTMPRESVNALLAVPKSLRRGRLHEVAVLLDSHLKSYRMAQELIEHPPHAVKVIEIAPNYPLKSRLLGSSADALMQDYRTGQLCGRAFLENYAWRLVARRPASLHPSSVDALSF